ncbi:MAG: DUF1080 domain-containing protein [Pirellulaceae bacterium]|nr:DUF1080 domain-containing protein [Pirellulaceae bacterium]
MRSPAISFLIVLLLGGAVTAEENQLTEQEMKAGWILLFDGKTLDGWMTSDQKQSQRPVEQESINPHRCGHYMMVHEKTWHSFVLRLDFKISPGCNSGVFFRTSSLEPQPGKDVGFNGLEIAIDDTSSAGYHDTGAIYDLVQPSENRMKPAGEWNQLELRCRGNNIRVAINGGAVARMNCREFNQPQLRPDGTSHKFPICYSEHPKTGYIGLQDHGSDCWFKNIKLRVLRPRPRGPALPTGN